MSGNPTNQDLGTTQPKILSKNTHADRFLDNGFLVRLSLD
jgi:hypothetical protein